MSIYNGVYLGLICCALLFAIRSYKFGVEKSIYISLVLAATLSVEIFSTFAIDHHIDFGWTYHFFNPIEYSLFCLYYLKGCGPNKFRSIVKLSIPLFIVFSLSASYMSGFQSMPAVNINVEGFLLFVLYTHLLFCLDADIDIPIYYLADFWISVGVLIFFGGVFIFLGLYPFLFNVNHDETMKLFSLITRPLNLIFYICIIIGLIWSIRKRKYFISYTG